jgi:hypothetical protein
MLASHARPVFIAACALNLLCALLGAFAIETGSPVAGLVAVIGGAAAFVAAAVFAIRILTHDGGLHSKWVKAALVFLVLGAIGFWGLQQPAMAHTICIAAQGCSTEAATASHVRAIGDVIQSQLATIGVALAAFICAARALSVTLDELAL